jgi:hypothetical protein
MQNVILFRWPRRVLLPGHCAEFYVFALKEKSRANKGAKVELIVAGQLVIGNITGILNGRIIITVTSDRV